jgi:hypothetical protein
MYMYTYIHIYIYMYIHIHKHIYICTHVCKYNQVVDDRLQYGHNGRVIYQTIPYIYMYINIYLYIHVYIYIHV